MKRFLYLLSGLIASLLLIFASSISANAVDFSIQVVSLAEYSSPAFSLDGYNYKVGLIDLPSSYVGAIHVNTGSSYPLSKGDFVQVNTTIVSNGVCNSTDVVDLGGSSSKYPLLDMKIVGQQSYNGIYCATIVNTIYRSEQFSNISIYTFPAFFQNNAGSKFHQVRVNSVSFFRYNGSSQSNLAPVLDYINNFHKQTSQQLSILFNEVHAYRTETGNKLDAINSVLGQIKNESTNLGSSVDNLNQSQQDHWKEEEQQREEDENKANQSGQDSQDKSDASQSELDGASKSLFGVLTGFVSSITNTKPGTCTISANFGFFDAGNINLCTGASKIVPITNVVGSVVLIGLIIPACISLLHRFLSLYNEVMS